eukprot:363637-Chlamydomonas_euryale.AAC.7
MTFSSQAGRATVTVPFTAACPASYLGPGGSNGTCGAVCCSNVSVDSQKWNTSQGISQQSNHAAKPPDAMSAGHAIAMNQNGTDQLPSIVSLMGG